MATSFCSTLCTIISIRLPSWYIAYTWLWRRCFPLGFTKALGLHIRVYLHLPPLAYVLSVGISPEPSSCTLFDLMDSVDGLLNLLWPSYMFLDHVFDVLHHLVLTAIASLTPLFS